MKLLPSFAHLDVVINRYEFLSSNEHKKRRMLVTKQLKVPIDFHSVFFHTIEDNKYHQLFGLIIFFRTSSFVFNRRKKLTQVYNNIQVSK